MSLCRRCEHRARALETQRGPRYECTDFGKSVHNCYMYQPVKPVILKRQKGDRRPQFAGAAFAARSEFAGVADMELTVTNSRGGKVLYWRPKA